MDPKLIKQVVGQGKIFVRPIQKTLSVIPIVKESLASTILKEKCVVCGNEFLLNDLRRHTDTCFPSIRALSDLSSTDSDASEDLPSLSGRYNEERSDIESVTQTVEATEPSESVEPTTIELTIDTVMQNAAAAPATTTSDLSNVVEPSANTNELTTSTALQVTITSESISIANAELNPNSSSEPNLEDNHLSEGENIEEKIERIICHCRTNQIDYPVGILKTMQQQLIVGRPLEITDPTTCLEGDTNFIVVDRENLLSTAFSEIKCLENLFITLEVQFDEEVNCFQF